MNLPSVKQLITVEQTQFAAADTESLAQAIGQTCNWVIDNISASPVGTIRHSLLSLVQFQAFVGVDWVLADGQNVTGSLYHTVTGRTTVPDLRATYLRGLPSGDPNTNLGQFLPDSNALHNHPIAVIQNLIARTNFQFVRQRAAPPQSYPRTEYDAAAFNGSTLLSVFGSEFRPKTIVVNMFIRIN